MREPTPKTTRPGVYLTDNGRALCLEHLGCSALYTGRDISGQPIEYVGSVADAALLGIAEIGMPIRCESCVAIAERAS